MSTSLSRRRFLIQSGAVTAGLAAAPAFVRGQAQQNVRLAVIGSGGRGGRNMKSLLDLGGAQVTVLCDVNEQNLESAAKLIPAARKFVDFRKLFDAADEFDAVVVSTCEHTHALATMLALNHRKHVFCEKPLTHNVWEARQIRLAAQKAGVATIMGIQNHANENYRRVVELIQSGAIGNVTEAHVWVSRAWGLQSKEASDRNKDRVFVTERPRDEMEPPAGLHWDLWLGPAPARPYHDVYFPGPKWYRWWDFGSGTMSDLGSHWNDLPFWALNLDAPRTIVAGGAEPHPEIAPASMFATYEFAARGNRGPVKLTWYQGEEKPEIWKSKGIPQWDNGHLFIGDKGMLLSDYRRWVLLPEEKFKDFKEPEPFLPRVESHYAEFLAACRTGSPTGANFDYSGWLTEMNHLGNVAFRAGKKLQWDPRNMRATNAPEADKFIRRQYREGWVWPGSATA